MHANKHISPWPFASHNEFGNGASHPSCAHGRAGADARGVRHTATALPLCAARAEPLVRAVIAVRKLHASSTLPMAKEQGMHQEGGAAACGGDRGEELWLVHPAPPPHAAELRRQRKMPGGAVQTEGRTRRRPRERGARPSAAP